MHQKACFHQLKRESRSHCNDSRARNKGSHEGSATANLYRIIVFRSSSTPGETWLVWRGHRYVHSDDNGRMDSPTWMIFKLLLFQLLGLKRWAIPSRSSYAYFLTTTKDYSKQQPMADPT